MKNKSLILTGALLVAIIIIAGILYPTLAEKANKAPEITTEQTTSSTDSTNITDNTDYPRYTDIKIFDKNKKEVKLSDFEGKPVILNFWATWCGYCLYELPDFENAFKEYGDDIQFVIVNTDDGIKKGEKYINSKNYTFPTYYDLDYDAYFTYGLSSLPRTVAIDKDGFVRYNRSGMIDAQILESIINMIK